MATQNEVILYKNIVMQKLLESNILTELVDVEGEYAGHEEDLLYKRIYPYEYIPDIIEETGCYILFDIDVELNRRNKTFNKFNLFIYTLAHVNTMRTPTGLRPDLMVTEIEKIFEGFSILGVGEMQLVYNRRFYTGERFRGRALCFEMADFRKEPR